MNIQQLQYVLAVAQKRHFEKAAEQCFITQSTLSTMISKFEDEIGIRIFDRRKKPVQITAEGALLIDQIQKIIQEIQSLDELCNEIKGVAKGTLSISVIPTIAPFLLPLFIQEFAARFPGLEIQVKESTTDQIVQQLRSRELDIGILSIPVRDKDLREIRLYDEPFLYYGHDLDQHATLRLKDMNIDKLCLLEEGHCMRTQVMNLCDMHQIQLGNTLNFDYKAGSIDSLLRFVKANSANTLLPYLATLDLAPHKSFRATAFESPTPYRTVGIAVHQDFVKHKVLDELITIINKKVSTKLPDVEINGEMLLPTN